jgi:hypothetical protein
MQFSRCHDALSTPYTDNWIGWILYLFQDKAMNNKSAARSHSIRIAAAIVLAACASALMWSSTV